MTHPLGDITSLREGICFVLRSEDAKGNFVRTRIYPGLSQESMRQYGRDSLSVSDPGGFSQEYAEDERANGGISALGIEYLIDGDNKGIRGIENQEYRRMYYTYLTYRDAQGSYVQLELEEPQVLASVRMYGAISNADSQWDFDDGDFYYGYDERLPNHVRLWVTNDDALAAKPDGKDAEDHWTENWTLLAEFYQPADRSGDDWTAHDPINGNDYDLWVAAKPYYADIVCDIVEEKFKYIRVETVDHFASWFLVGDNSKDHFVTYHELEVYVKKD